MIRVYAFEPITLLDEKVQQAMESLGFDHGRFIAAIPKSWRKKVLELYKSKVSQDKDFEIFLERLWKKRIVVNVQSNHAENVRWIDSAISSSPSHLHGIICDENTKSTISDCRIMSRRDLHDDHPIWKIKANDRVNRSSKEMAECLRVLLRYSSTLSFIDPFLFGSKKHLAFIEACIRIVAEEKLNRFERLEFHQKYDVRKSSSSGGGRSVESDNRVKEEFDRFVDKVRKIVGIECFKNVHFYCWNTVDGGERFHERYVATDRGMFDFTGGLDEGQKGQKTPVNRMDEKFRQEIEQLFLEGTSAFELIFKKLM